MHRKGMFLAGLILASACVQAAEPVPLADFARHMQFKDAKISPDGKHLAATAVVGGNVVLSMIDLGNNTALTVQARNGDDVFQFWWASNDRVVYAVAEHGGALEEPIPTGELYATNFDGKARAILFGYRASDSESGSTGTRIEKKQNEFASAWMLDALPDDPKYSLIVVQPWSKTPGADIKSEVRRIDLDSGKTRTVVTAPMTGAEFITDHKGVVRFAVGNEIDQKQKVYYREGDGKDWELVFSETGSGKTLAYALPLLSGRSCSIARAMGSISRVVAIIITVASACGMSPNANSRLSGAASRLARAALRKPSTGRTCSRSAQCPGEPLSPCSTSRPPRPRCWSS